MNWKLGACLYWLVWFLGFVAWEAYAGSEKMGAKDVPMLTQAVVRYVPWWITLPGITWLFVHFAVRYANPKYIEWLKTGQQ
jgi:hypothetical protein